MSYTIEQYGTAIRCLTCHRTSWNMNDVENRYCGFCHVYHQDNDERIAWHAKSLGLKPDRLTAVQLALIRARMQNDDTRSAE